ncbi:hypothetical protein ABIF90_007278 [Bradyrhizobium japonicum]
MKKAPRARVRRAARELALPTLEIAAMNPTPTALLDRDDFLRRVRRIERIDALLRHKCRFSSL